MPDINEWLEQWIDNNINVPQYEEDKIHMQHEADALKVEAVAAGFSLKQLTDACEGDILAHLQSAQNSLTDDHINYLSSKDD